MKGPLRPRQERALVLLSGGLDSVVATTWAAGKFRDVLALTFDYGQRAVAEELRSAQAVSELLRVRWLRVELSWLSRLGSSALVTPAKPIPTVNAAGLDDERSSRESAQAVWVPNRNGVFVAVAGAFAEAWLYSSIVLGLNREEGASFPDNTAEFAAAASALMAYSTMTGPKVVSPTVDMTKAQIVRLGLELEAPLDLVWSCYGSGEEHCWTCASCRRLRRALEEARAWPEHQPRWGHTG